MDIQQIKGMIQKGKYEDALHQIENLPKEKRLDGKILEGRILIWKSEFEKALSLAEEALQESKKKGKIILEVAANVVTAWSLWRLGKTEKALEVISQGENILNGMNTETRTEGLEWEGQLHGIKSQILHAIGKRNLALSSLKTAIKIHEELGQKYYVALGLNAMGELYLLKGDLNQALDYYHKSTIMYEELGNEHDIAFPLANLGEAYRMKGELNEAFRYLQKSLKIFEDFEDKQMTYLVLGDIGHVYRARGELEKAFNTYNRCLTLSEEVGNEKNISSFLYHLVLNSIEMNAKDQAKDYLQQLQQMDESTKTDVINFRSRLAKAIFLKSSPRAKHKIEAQSIFEKIIGEEIFNFAYTVLAMLNLCELLLDEAKLYGEAEVLEEVSRISEKIHQIAQNQNSYPLIIQTLLLRSKFAILQNSPIKADKLLAQAYIIAEEKELTSLAKKISVEQENLEKELAKWAEIARKSFQDRLDHIKIQTYIAEAMKVVHGEKE